jgi:hypothetical protein
MRRLGFAMLACDKCGHKTVTIFEIPVLTHSSVKQTFLEMAAETKDKREH